MEMVFIWSEDGNMEEDDNMVGTMSNVKQPMEHVSKYGESFRLMKRKRSTN